MPVAELSDNSQRSNSADVSPTSRDASPTSTGFKRKREEDDDPDSPEVEDQPPRKRRTPTPPSSSSPPRASLAAETPRVLQIQKRVEDLHVGRVENAKASEVDPLRELEKTETINVQPFKEGDTSSTGTDSSEEKELDEPPVDSKAIPPKAIEPGQTPESSPEPEKNAVTTKSRSVISSPDLSFEDKNATKDPILAVGSFNSTSSSPRFSQVAKVEEIRDGKAIPPGATSYPAMSSQVGTASKQSPNKNTEETEDADSSMKSIRPIIDDKTEQKEPFPVLEEPVVLSTSFEGGSSLSSSPRRARMNGFKKSKDQERPIEVDASEKSLKRKASDRVPAMSFSTPVPKRAKEDQSAKSIIAEEPAEQERPKTPVRASKPMGFSAFAATESPFASVRSENAPFGGGTRPSTLFSSSAPVTASFPVISPFSNSPPSLMPSVFATKDESKTDPISESKPKTPGFSTPSAFPASVTPVFGAISSVGQSSGARFGLSMFGVPGSPSARLSSAGPTRRAKSPRPMAFGAYGTSAGRFAAPATKILAKSKKDSEEGKGSEGNHSSDEKEEEEKPKKSFSEMLAATGSDGEPEDDADKKVYEEQETITGEEQERNIWHSRGKLYAMHDGQWKERGPGIFKLNVSKQNGLSARVVMRRDAALNLLVNAKLFKGMKFLPGPDPRYVTFTVLDENSKLQSLLLKLNSSKLASDLLDIIPSYIPK